MSRISRDAISSSGQSLMSEGFMDVIGWGAGGVDTRIHAVALNRLNSVTGRRRHPLVHGRRVGWMLRPLHVGLRLLLLVHVIREGIRRSLLLD